MCVSAILTFGSVYVHLLIMRDPSTKAVTFFVGLLDPDNVGVL